VKDDANLGSLPWSPRGGNPVLSRQQQPAHLWETRPLLGQHAPLVTALDALPMR